MDDWSWMVMPIHILYLIDVTVIFKPVLREAHASDDRW